MRLSAGVLIVHLIGCSACDGLSTNDGEANQSTETSISPDGKTERASSARQLPHPDDRSKQVEYFVEAPAGNGPWPTVILLHGHQESPRPGGEVFVDWGVLKQLAKRGYLAVAVSQPGYGNSTGPADFSGAFTQHAVQAVIAKLRSEGQASSNNLLIEGISRGAVTAGLVAAHDPSVTGLVLISGVYDFSAFVAEADANSVKRAIAQRITTESGGTPDALKARSVLHYPGRIKAQSLILSGANDDRTDPQQSRRLSEEINRNGGTARAIIYPDFGHHIPPAARNKDVDPFIDKVLKPSGAP